MIHPQLNDDCIVLGRFPLCHLLLAKDANYPWFILVPDRKNITEAYQLSEPDQQQLMIESNTLGAYVMSQLQGDKLNVAALGNRVSQLHVHVIVRYQHDAAWPDPIWGRVAATPYQPFELKAFKQKLNLSALQQFTAVAES